MIQNILLLVLAALLVMLYRRRFHSESPSKPRRAERDRVIGKYHAVSIRPASMGCPASRALKGRRYLSSEAPQLPVEDCNAAVCQCVYNHHADRRTGNLDRRALGSTVRSSVMASGRTDRRSGIGRRKSDLEHDLSWV